MPMTRALFTTAPDTGMSASNGTRDTCGPRTPSSMTCWRRSSAAGEKALNGKTELRRVTPHQSATGHWESDETARRCIDLAGCPAGPLAADVRDCGGNQGDLNRPGLFPSGTD